MYVQLRNHQGEPIGERKRVSDFAHPMGLSDLFQEQKYIAQRVIAQHLQVQPYTLHVRAERISGRYCYAGIGLAEHVTFHESAY